MNKFKYVIQEPRYQNGSKRREQVQVLNILDKCTRKKKGYIEILRDDRIWLRNKVKEVDREILAIFKKHMSKKPLDMSALQIGLRKYIMSIKDKCKKEQLMRFKENSMINSLEMESKKDKYGYQKNRKEDNRREFYQPYQNNYCQKQTVFRNTMRQEIKRQPDEYQDRRKTLLSTIKMTDPIEEQDQMEQGYSYRSKSGYHNRNRTSQYESHKHQQFAPWRKSLNNRVKTKQEEEYYYPEKDNDYQQQEDQQQYYPQTLINPREHIQPPLAPRQRPVQYQTYYQIQDSNIQSNVTNSIPVNSKFDRTSFNHFHDQVSEKINQSNTFILQHSNLQQPPSFSATPVASDNKHMTHFTKNKTFAPLIQSNPADSCLTYQNCQNDSLFTNPELLNQCRRFLQQSMHKRGNDLSSSINSNTFCNQPTFVQRSSFQDLNSSLISKSNFQQPFVPSVSPSKKRQAFPQENNTTSFDIHIGQSYKLIKDVSKLYAEDLFDIFFPSPAYSIDLEKYESIVYKNFSQTQTLIQLFKLGDKYMTNTILATQFGKLLLSICNYKPNPNPVKQIFSLIDIQRKGYFTLEDYERFLQQVIDPDDQCFNQILNICEQLFQTADISKTQKIQYWGLYLAKDSKQFEQFSIFLEQFEFQVQRI